MPIKNGTPGITVDCARTHSNLLQISADKDAVYLFYILEDAEGHRQVVGNGEFLTYQDHPELRDIVRVTTFDEVWNADMLLDLVMLHEDHAITELGRYALDKDELWETAKAPDFVNGSCELGIAI